MSFAFALSWKVTSPHQVIVGLRCLDGAGPGYVIASDAEIRDGWKTVKIFAGAHGRIRMPAQDLARIVSVDMIGNERQSPLEGAHDTIIVSLVMGSFSPMHVIFPK